LCRVTLTRGFWYLIDALVSVGHDFGIEIDGFRVPGI
jgi:hypothetical protein